MLPVEVMRQIRRLQLRARRAVRTLFGGEYRSAFKGAGLSFEEVREYQPGDDVRSIDWNVTARMGTAFVKRYAEERELTVVLMVDFSASRLFDQTQVADEVAFDAAFAALDGQRLEKRRGSGQHGASLDDHALLENGGRSEEHGFAFGDRHGFRDAALEHAHRRLRYRW